jgi:5-methylcytosine-specific restriction endonuclease McrA
LGQVIPHQKPARRIRDKEAFAVFHAKGRDCLSCGHGRSIQAHHILHRRQGGDDTLANLVPLCVECHLAYHGQPYRAYGVKIDANHVRQAIARYIRSEAGDDARWYLTGRMGPGPALAFLERLEA